ncbi:unnamed protein product [Bursaphelenchus xylophilus]|uniref:(pine wood nematode) hypothetical protein n=1 Tax=Bursaphelenchus xylophilus TaxID=6326 RepID=A0A1I7RZX9_BURXY|nr:unnamed protein product [Bursaphelenchus xylophilus]CAG9109158.1 unnamed protein product [Bursaphelenchus xylophilus]
MSDTTCCCCRCNSLSIVKVLSILSMILSALLVITFSIDKIYHFIVCSAIIFGLSGLLFVGAVAKKRFLFVPFLICNALTIAGVLILVGLIILKTVGLFDGFEDGESSDVDNETMKIGLPLSIAFFSLVFIFDLWCEYVVYKAFKSLRMQRRKDTVMSHFNLCCIYKVHIDTVVKAVAVATFVLSFLGILGFFAGFGATAIVSVVLTAACSGCLLYGVIREQELFYWPYMVWNGIKIIVSIVGIIIVALVVAAVSSDNVVFKDADGNILTKEQRDRLKTLCILALVVYSFDIILAILFQYIVMKGHRSMKSRTTTN